MPTPRRKWSQHWLANDELADALVRLIEPREHDRFLEIGAGNGRLTASLLRHPVTVTAVEIDPRCCALLRELGAGRSLRVIEADVLQVDLAKLDLGPPLRVVGNLPYSIASPILRWTVRHRKPLTDAHYMLPAEVAERVLAAPGCRQRGLLSVLVQWEFEGEVLRQLGPGAFRPPPTIDSAFIRLQSRQPQADQARPDYPRAVVEAAFAHRRKTLANALERAGWNRDEIYAACRSADVDPGARAEALSVGEYARLAEALPGRSQ